MGYYLTPTNQDRGEKVLCWDKTNTITFLHPERERDSVLSIIEATTMHELAFFLWFLPKTLVYYRKGGIRVEIDREDTIPITTLP